MCPSGGISFQNVVFTFFLRVIIDSSMSHSIMPKILTVNLPNKEKSIILRKAGRRWLLDAQKLVRGFVNWDVADFSFEREFLS